MAAGDVDVGELIRTLIEEESGIIRHFEEKEASVEKARKEIDARVSKILVSERKNAEEEAKRILEEQEKASESEYIKLLKEKEEKIKALGHTVEKDRARLVDASLSLILKEVSDALSTQTR